MASKENLDMSSKRKLNENGNIDVEVRNGYISPKKVSKLEVNSKREDFLSWEDYFMSVAFLSAMRSKDPSSQVRKHRTNRYSNTRTYTYVKAYAAILFLNNMAAFFAAKDYFVYLSGIYNCKVGACIVNKNNKIVGIGYNGMPTGCSDDEFPWRKDSLKAVENKYMYGKFCCVCNLQC